MIQYTCRIMCNRTAEKNSTSADSDAINALKPDLAQLHEVQILIAHLSEIQNMCCLYMSRLHLLGAISEHRITFLSPPALLEGALSGSLRG